MYFALIRAVMIRCCHLSSFSFIINELIVSVLLRQLLRKLKKEKREIKLITHFLPSLIIIALALYYQYIIKTTMTVIAHTRTHPFIMIKINILYVFSNISYHMQYEYLKETKYYLRTS